MPPREPFTVKFGKSARTVEYDDPVEHILFTFDFRDQITVVLEHHAPATPRSPGYAIAFQRTKDFLASKFARVEVFGE
jgi:hypothetical protein